MPLAPNPLLLATPVAKSQPAVATPVVKPVETGKDSTPSFAHVYAKQASPKPAVIHETRQKPVKDKTVAANSKPAPDTKSAGSKPAVADSGKQLPAGDVSKKNDASNSAAGHDSKDKAPDPLAQAAAPVIPIADPTLIAAAVAPPVPDPALLVAVVQPPIEIPATMVALVVAPPAIPVSSASSVSSTGSSTPATAPVFNPASDPLAGLAAVQVAVQLNTKVATTTASATEGATSTSADKKTSATQANADPLLAVANNLAVPAQPLAADSASTGSGDGAFKGLIEGGLKDTKSVASDTRIDDFANRLAALSQAVQPKTAAVTGASPLNQPLAMHQSGWSEAVVDRVMYLSSQNLKSADIQLDPAELGRLDIRINMAADQQTQITFMSAHVGVREALEGQMSKLRDSFVQQGLGQVDVSVFDQSRGWQGQGQNQQQANHGQNSGGVASMGSDRNDGHDDGAIQDVAVTSQPMTVIGTSQVDYYA